MCMGECNIRISELEGGGLALAGRDGECSALPPFVLESQFLQ